MTDFNPETNLNPETEGVSRRRFLSRVAAAGLGTAALGLAASVQAATKPEQPQADTGHNYPMAKPHAMTAKQFYMGVIDPLRCPKLPARSQWTRPQTLMQESLPISSCGKRLPLPPYSQKWARQRRR